MDFLFNTFLYWRLGSHFDHQSIFNYLEYDHKELSPIDQPLLCPLEISLIPKKKYNVVRICIISDTHERHYLLPKIPPCDILIHAGDIFMTNSKMSTVGSIDKINNFNDWLKNIEADKKIIIAGNHDKIFETLGIQKVQNLLTNCLYLCNNIIKVNNLTIFATPISNGKSHNKAFQNKKMKQETMNMLETLNESNKLIDIVISHGPLDAEASRLQQLKLHVWGHAHEFYGVRKLTNSANHSWLSVCACSMNGRYDISNSPIIIDYVI